MRKIVLIFIMLSLAVICGWVVYDGVKIGSFEIYSYAGIDQKSNELDKLIKDYDSKNPGELKQKQTEIVKEIEEYETIKSQ